MKPTSLIFCIFLAANNAFAHRVGNGGDHVRATYIQMGEAVLEYLNETQQGQKLVSDNGLSPSHLQSTLDIEKISVTDDLLRDNSGSVAEAIGVADSVTLNKEAWFSHFEKAADIYYLVFHEMLRSAAVNDDNYVISKYLFPFPVTRKIASKVTPVVALIADDNLSQIFAVSKVAVNGNGCPLDLAGTQVSVDEETNTLSVSTRHFRTDSNGTRQLLRKSCALAIPVKLPAKKRIVISQIDIRGKVSLQTKSQSQVSFEAFLAGKSNALKIKTMKALSKPLDGRFQMRRTEVLKSNCGGQDILRMNSALLTDAQGLKPESANVSETMVYLNLEDCI